MAIPETIKKLANDIRTKIYGREVREALAQGVEEAGNIADQANQTSNAAVEQVRNIQAQVDQLVVEGDSSVEAAQARVDAEGNVFATLKERLDTKETQIEELHSRLDISDQKISNLEELKADKTEMINNIEKSRPISFERVKFIAHRGFSWLAPENSKAAFYMAGTNRGAFWGVETDIHFTKDGHWICMHDDTVDRTTDGTGYIRDMTLAQIKELTIDYNAPSQVPINDNLIDKKVPTLEEYLQIMSEMNLFPIIEIKSDGDFLSLYYMIKRYGFEDKCIVISFYPEYLQNLRAHSKRIKMMLLSSYFMPEDIEVCKEIGNCGISVDYSKMTPENINIARTHGLEFGVWTVDDIPTIVHARRLGVDYITTNMGAGRFVNKYKRFALTKDFVENRLIVSQTYSSEDATLEWHSGYQAVKVTYEYPFPAMFTGTGTGAFLSQHTGTMALGYEFSTRSEGYDCIYLQVKKNGNIINPLTDLIDNIWVNILILSY